MLAEINERLSTLTSTINTLNSHLSQQEININSQSSTAKYIVNGAWVLVVVLIGNGISILFQELANK